MEIIVNGSNVACYYRNLWIEPGTLSSGIEVYTVQDGRVHVCIFH